MTFAAGRLTQGATAGSSSSAVDSRVNTAGQAGSGTRLRLHRRTGGYTLVELLVTITIIAIVAGFSLGGLFKAQDVARQSRTRGIIAKLHGQMMLRWESYETRRVPIAIDALNPNDPESSMKAAGLRLQALRQLMRLELPDRWTDIADLSDPANPQPVVVTYLTSHPALSEAYFRAYEGNTDPVTGQTRYPTDLYQAAECLYLILSMGHDDALGTDRINMREVGDVDQDGMKEFLDGWGRPIRFLRWAPGFLPTPNADHLMETAAPARKGGSDEHPLDSNELWPRAATDLQTGDPEHDADPFDFRRADAWTDAGALALNKNPPDTDRGYRLMPLIYSDGPDGIPDIKGDDSDETTGTLFNYGADDVQIDPYAKPPTDQRTGAVVMIGAPYDLDDDGSFDHLDNITNHRLDIRQGN